MENAKLELISPWINFYKEIEALFERDPEVHVSLEEHDEKTIVLRVDSGDKALALDRIMPKERTFGNVTVKIMVIPANEPEDWDTLKTVETAFRGNEAFTGTLQRVTLFGTLKYVLFDKIVVQYANDDIGDANLVRSTLYQDIARDVLGETLDGVYFCTQSRRPRTIPRIDYGYEF